MLFLISPAKTLDYETPVPVPLRRHATEPLFTAEAAELITLLRRKSAAQVGTLMDLSPRLSALNVERYAAWVPKHTPANSKPAVLAFDGDVYDGLRARELSTASMAWAQKHLVILSGLYGVLRPLDRLQPYRLEMGTALRTPRGKDLYAWWGGRLVQHLNERQAGDAAPVIVNLASIEYANAVLRPAVRDALRGRVVGCVFEEAHDGGWRIVSFHAKKARGLMARFAIESRARSVNALKRFDDEGYAFAIKPSTPECLVFRRGAA